MYFVIVVLIFFFFFYYLLKFYRRYVGRVSVSFSSFDCCTKSNVLPINLCSRVIQIMARYCFVYGYVNLIIIVDRGEQPYCRARQMKRYVNSFVILLIEKYHSPFFFCHTAPVRRLYGSVYTMCNRSGIRIFM